MSQPAPINPFDRLGLTLFFAVSLHMALILGLGFNFEQPRQQTAARTLEIMVVQNPRKSKAPEKADFLAQTSQEGGGLQEKKVRPTTVPQTPPTPRPIKKSPREDGSSTAAKRVPSLAQKTITVQRPSKKPSSARTAAAAEKKRHPSAAQLLASTSWEIKRLSAELDRKAEAFAKRPRRKHINASTREFKYANYLDAWRRKVERIGNLNYPDEAKRRKLYGNLVLHVAVRADGTVERIRLRQSSGHKLLDDAAIRIVRLAAPFAPFPAEIRKETDIIDITRTWQFLSDNRLGWKN